LSGTGSGTSLIAATTPSVSEAIAATARERGIKVTIAPPSRSHRQAIAMRRLVDSVSSRFGPGDELPAIEDGNVDEHATVDPN
jgi:hypothetical protein